MCPARSPAAALPPVHALLRHERLQALPREVALRSSREVLDSVRPAVLAGDQAPSLDTLVDLILRYARAEEQPAVRRVLNATGVVLHTNLGRAPLGEVVARAVAEAARGYSSVEMDLENGIRGDRLDRIRHHLREISGAEDAVVVNNNAAAVFLAMSALAQGRQVVASRGEMVEIGGSFRIPEVAVSGGVHLVEVGTTNRTRIYDYERGITPETVGFLRVHPSNFRIVGFTETPDRRGLADLAHKRGLWMMEDLGSGNLMASIPDEPVVREVIAAGVDLVCFSGDKLLGGPQAGILVGRTSLVSLLRRHPLYRALRLDKLCIAALDAALRLHRAGRTDDLPAPRMMGLGPAQLLPRAQALAQGLSVIGLDACAEPADGRTGAGALPEHPLPGVAVVVRGQSTVALVRELRCGTPPLVARVHDDSMILDPRTLLPDDDALIVGLVQEALDRLRGATGTSSARGGEGYLGEGGGAPTILPPSRAEPCPEPSTRSSL